MKADSDRARASLPVDPAALGARLKAVGRADQDALLRPSLERVVGACVDLFGVDGSGIMLTDELGALRHVVATDDTGQRLEEAQLETGEGPCVDAFFEEAPVVVEDLRTEERWSRLRIVLSDSGIRGVLAVPIRLSGTPVGTLNLYRSTPTGWGEDVSAAVLRFAEVAEELMRSAVAAEHAGELAAQLAYAVEHRAPIERAVGYLMARRHLAQREAFELLRATARSSRRRIGDVADELLSTGSLGTPTTSGTDMAGAKGTTTAGARRTRG
jgi:GAF domain-containing protein